MTQLAAEVRRAPLARAALRGGAISVAGAKLGRKKEGLLAGLCVALLEHSLSSHGHRLDRAIRNAEDAALMFGRLGRDAASLGRWAIEADFARIVIEELERRPSVVVELGSGVSTLLMAQVLDQQKSGQLITIDHDAHFAERTQALHKAEVAHRTHMIVAPLTRKQFGRTATEWYDRSVVDRALGDERIDLLVIDGPPDTHAWSRWPALEVLLPYLSDGAVALLDDGRERHEREAAFRWAREHPSLALYWLDTLKGTWRIEKTDAGSESASERRLRQIWRTLIPHPAGFGRWPVRR